MELNEYSSLPKKRCFQSNLAGWCQVGDTWQRYWPQVQENGQQQAALNGPNVFDRTDVCIKGGIQILYCPPIWKKWGS